MLGVASLSVIMLSITNLSIILNVVMLSVVMLTVVLSQPNLHRFAAIKVEEGRLKKAENKRSTTKLVPFILAIMVVV
jgi:hypothetical protein